MGRGSRARTSERVARSSDCIVRVLSVDIETAPNMAYCWGLWDQREASRRYRLAHPDKCRESQRNWRELHREYNLARLRKIEADFREWLVALNATYACILCDGSVDTWHHVDPFSKVRSIASMGGRSLDAIERELEKCVPMCHSCHSRYHHPKLWLEVRKCAS